MATIMDGGGNYELEEPREEEEEECAEQTMQPSTADVVVAEDPFADEEDSDSAVPTRHLSTSSEGSSIEIGVGEEVDYRTNFGGWVDLDLRCYTKAKIKISYAANQNQADSKTANIKVALFKVLGLMKHETPCT